MRAHDVVLFGATGFTGAADRASTSPGTRPPDCRWALAGRNRGKLDAVRDAARRHRRRARRPRRCWPPTSGDPASLAAVAEATRVVITTVGPYLATASRWWPPAPRPAPTTST